MNNFEIIIPAYNEEENIAGLIRTIKEAIGESGKITVIDDASEDKTAEIAAGCKAEVIRHPYRIGNGACVKTGLRHSTADIVVCMDGDGQHSPEDIPKLLSQMENFDMIIGARDFSKLTSRNIANKLYNLFAGYVTLFKIQDLTSGFRAVKRREALKFLYLLPNSFSYPTTLTLSFLKTGRTIKYIPTASSVRKSGKSKINLTKDGTRFFLIILKIAIFFSPLKVFLPLSALCFCAGGLYYLYTFLNSHRFTNMSALLLTTSIIIFMLGLVSEQIAQLRMDKTEN
ncbi:MAG: glycosyltransferase family 2 protein [Candidatus Omnitrophota bacterium]